MSNRIAHLILEEDSEDVWMAGGPHGMITLHVVNGHPDVIVAHSPREIPGWEKTPGCMRMEGLPCWYIRGLEGAELCRDMAESGITDEQATWGMLDDCYRLYLGRQR